MKYLEKQLLSFSLIIVLISCITTNSNNNEIVQSTQEYNIIKDSSNWVNINYINCLKKNPPCYCIRKSSIAAILLHDSLKKAKVYSYNVENVTYEIDIDSSESRFLIYYSINKFSMLDTNLHFNSSFDTMFFDNEKFVPYYGEDKNRITLIDKINTSVFNKNYGQYFKEFNISNYFLQCHPYEKVNYLFSGKCSEYYIIEYASDSISLIEVTNGCDQTPLNNNNKTKSYKKFPR